MSILRPVRPCAVVDQGLIEVGISPFARTLENLQRAPMRDQMAVQ